MATIGLDNVVYAKVTAEAPGTGAETYGAPVKLAKAISANISVETLNAMLNADDGVSERVDEFKNGTLSLGVDDIGAAVAADLLGATVDQNGVLVSTAEDISNYVAIGFRAKRSNGKYQYFWLYRVKFSLPATALATKGDSITFNTPTIEGTILRRNKADSKGNHPWKTDVVDGASGVNASTITNWFTAVYEPLYTDTSVKLNSLTIGSVNLSPTFDGNTTEYTATTSNATNTITAACSTNDAHYVITVNGDSLTNGTAATWAAGTNTVLVTLIYGLYTKVYTITVTKE